MAGQQPVKYLPAWLAQTCSLTEATQWLAEPSQVLAASLPVAAVTACPKPAAIVMGMRNLLLLDIATAGPHPGDAGKRSGAYRDMTPLEIFWDILTNRYRSAPSIKHLILCMREMQTMLLC